MSRRALALAGRMLVLAPFLLPVACDPGTAADAVAGADGPPGPPPSAFVASGLGAPCSLGTSALVVNEIRVDPDDPSGSWVEVHNPGGAAVDLGGLSLVVQFTPEGGPRIVRQDLPAGDSLAAGGYRLFCVDPDPARNGGAIGCTDPLAGLEPGPWSLVSLWDEAAGIPLDRVELASDAFPATASAALRHAGLDNLRLAAPVDPDDAGGWVGQPWGLSTAPLAGGSFQGTPGARNADAWVELDLPECDDADPCTWDRCVLGACDSTQRKAGCCTADTQCFDANLCTVDRCAANTCTHDRMDDCCRLNSDCEDGDPCTYDLCFDARCGHPRVSQSCCGTDADCDDGSACTRDRCLLGSCRYEADLAACCLDDAWCTARIDDGNPCTDARCVDDPLSGTRRCVNEVNAGCTLELPYFEDFEGPTSLEDRGWARMDAGTPAADHWSLATVGELGPDGHLAFGWTPTVAGVVSGAMTPRLDAMTPQGGVFGGRPTTIQWRMRYRHALPGRPVGLSVLATGTSSLADTPLWSRVSDEDLPYDLFTATVPESLKASPTLRLAFRVDTGASTTADLDGLEVDQVRVAVGVPNRLLRTFVLKCTDGKPCLSDTAPRLATVEGSGPLPDVTLTVCDRVRVLMCFRDDDASSSSWNFLGFPASFTDGPPLDVPAFIHPASDVGPSNGCETLPFAVSQVCGTGPEAGHFYCGLDVDPQCDDASADRYRTGLRTVDGYDAALPAGLAFESLTSAHVNVLLRDGWVVWSPLDWEDPLALEVRDAIRASGRKAMVVKDLALVPDLRAHAGVWAVLGVSGRYHEVTAAEAAMLKAFLDAGKGLLLEGGEFFSRPAGVQAGTSLHPYFRVRLVHGGTPRLAGPVTGRNFLESMSFDVLQEAAVNAGLDAIEHDPERGGREILRDQTGGAFATMVAYRGSYRTVASTLPFAGLAERAGGGTKATLMGRVLSFLEGSTPPCTSAAQCEDFESCTTDTCASGTCSNAWRSGCVPCVDDRLRPSGATSCSLDQACRPDLGYCVNVRCNGVACNFRYDAASPVVPAVLGAGTPLLELPVAVARTGLVGDLQVKVRARCAYRGALRLTLRGPDGTEVRLKEADLSDFGQDVEQTYDIGVPLPSGQALDAFLEKDYLGTWTLVVENLDPGLNTGYVDGWHLWIGKSPKCLVLAHCNDESVCTTDACSAGYCSNVSIPCGDGNGCTDDPCHAVTGCYHVNHTRPCDDGNACTAVDRCGGGACVPGGAVSCDDGNACTDDSCDPATGCAHVADDANPCGDGDDCTAGDQCAAGTCGGAPYACDDGVACTDDACDGAGGCSATLWDGWCLVGGLCVEAGQPDPGDPCRACDPATRPDAWTPLPEGSVCSDGKTCQSGACM